jgi:hypothetical protein|uniref:Uncharacterized protein n=1 Tax=Escherichia coli TaxID=562 RepID=A0A6D1P200_ECOLX|nr:hypothetical protein [Escherichia coli]
MSVSLSKGQGVSLKKMNTISRPLLSAWVGILMRKRKVSSAGSLVKKKKNTTLM